jgi:hypothetical protein
MAIAQKVVDNTVEAKIANAASVEIAQRGATSASPRRRVVIKTAVLSVAISGAGSASA